MAQQVRYQRFTGLRGFDASCWLEAPGCVVDENHRDTGREMYTNDEINFIQQLIARGGPEPEEYSSLDAWFTRIHGLVCTGVFAKADLLGLREAFGDAMSPATLQGFVCAQPHGYAGDFEIIDRIYLQHVSPYPHLARWDKYFLASAASKAVCNRKSYFHEILDRHSSRTSPFRVLKLASGPGRSMFEWLSTHPNAEVIFDCVEIDANAISYAKSLNHAFLDRISFQQKNVIRFRVVIT